jgi:hypothetical protein
MRRRSSFDSCGALGFIDALLFGNPVRSECGERDGAQGEQGYVGIEDNKEL